MRKNKITRTNKTKKNNEKQIRYSNNDNKCNSKLVFFDANFKLIDKLIDCQVDNQMMSNKIDMINNAINLQRYMSVKN